MSHPVIKKYHQMVDTLIKEGDKQQQRKATNKARNNKRTKKQSNKTNIDRAYDVICTEIINIERKSNMEGLRLEDIRALKELIAIQYELNRQLEAMKTTNQLAKLSDSELLELLEIAHNKKSSTKTKPTTNEEEQYEGGTEENGLQGTRQTTETTQEPQG